MVSFHLTKTHRLLSLDFYVNDKNTSANAVRLFAILFTQHHLIDFAKDRGKHARKRG